MNKIKISTSISLSFFITAVILTIVSLYVINLTVSRHLKEAIYAHLATAAKSRTIQLVSFLSEHQYQVERLASDESIRDVFGASTNKGANHTEDQTLRNVQIATHRLEQRIEAEEHFAEIFVLDRSGKTVLGTKKSRIGADRSGCTCFLKGLKGPYVSDCSRCPRAEEPSIFIGAPILDDKDKHILGVLVARLKLGSIHEITLDRTGLGETGEIYLIDKGGYLITPSRFANGLTLEQKVDTINARRCLAHTGKQHAPGDIPVDVFQNYQGTRVLGTHEYIPGVQWGLLTEISEKEALAPLRVIKLVFIGILILVPLAAWFIGFVLARRITAPIHKLKEGTEIVANGNLEYKIDVVSKNEIGELTEAFNKMLDDLKESTTSITELHKEIAEREQLETSLTNSEHKYRTLLARLPQRIFQKDINSVYQSCNENYARDLGIKPEEIIEKTDYEFFPKKLAEKYREDDKRVVTLKKTEEIEEMYVQEGQEVWVQTVKTPMKDEKGDVTGVLGIFWDITSRKRAEEAQEKYSQRLEARVEERTRELQEAQEQLVRREKLATLGQLAGGLGHELRNPLGAIKNAVYLLNMVLEVSDPEVKEALKIIEKEVGISERVISSLLNYARPTPANRLVVDVNEVVQEALSRVPLPENVELVRKLDDTLPTISGDSGQFVQVFENVIQNAYQAMPEGGQFTVKSEASNQEWLTVSCTDTGAGMDDETSQNIFEALFTTKAKGIGLGLSLCKMFVEAHKGSIDVESEAGKGTTFTVSLPISREERE